MAQISCAATLPVGRPVGVLLCLALHSDWGLWGWFVHRGDTGVLILLLFLWVIISQPPRRVKPPERPWRRALCSSCSGLGAGHKYPVF